MKWTAGRLRNQKGTYVQAVTERTKGARYTVGLGYMQPSGELTDEKVARAIAALNDAGDKLWRIPLGSVSDRGTETKNGAKWRGTLHEPEDPEKALKDAIRAYALGTFDLDGFFKKNEGDYRLYTFKQFVEEVFKPHRQAQVAALTWSGERDRLPRLVDHFGSMQMNALASVKPWIEFFNGPLSMTIPRTKGRGAHKDAKPKPTSPRTKAIFLALYKEVLKHAKTLGAIDKLPEFPPIKGSSKPTLEITPFTVEEAKKLLDQAPSPMYRALLGLGLGEGLRPGELVRVRWEDFNWERRFLSVRGTKTEKAEAPVPLTPTAEREMRAWWEANGRPTSGLCFSYRGKALGSFERGLSTAAERAGLADGRRIHPNMLRHTFAVLCAYSDPPVPIRTAMAIMRHSDEQMIMRVYTRAGHRMVHEGLGNFPDI